jgi:hypothetical protein
LLPLCHSGAVEMVSPHQFVNTKSGRTAHYTNLVLRALALKAPLNTSQIVTRMNEEIRIERWSGKIAGYQTIRRIVLRLEEAKKIVTVPPRVNDRRVKESYQLSDDEWIGHLFLQHYLTVPEVADCLGNETSGIISLYRKVGLKPDLKRILKLRAYAGFLSGMTAAHLGDSVTFIDEIERREAHVYHTMARDVKVSLVLALLSTVSKDDSVRTVLQELMKHDDNARELMEASYKLTKYVVGRVKEEYVSLQESVETAENMLESCGD